MTTGEQDGRPTITFWRNEEAVAAAGALDGLYGLATNLPDPAGRRLTTLDVLKIYKDQWVDEQRHRDLKHTLRVRPVFLHNDARTEGLVAVVGIALLIFGLVEAELRAALGDGAPLPGILPEGRAAKPTARAVLAAFDGLEVSYTKNGLVLDHLSNVQRLILALLGISLPFGLTMDRVDFLRRAARVDRQLVGVRGGVPEFGPPKSMAGFRTVPMPEVICTVVAAHLAHYGPGPGGVVFTNTVGNPLWRNTVNEMWHRAGKQSGLPSWATFHDLRHFYASLLIAKGCSVKVVQSRLGRPRRQSFGGETQARMVVMSGARTPRRRTWMGANPQLRSSGQIRAQGG